MLKISGPNSYVAVPSSTALNLAHGFTIECWARVQTLLNNAALFDKRSYGLFVRGDSSVVGSITHGATFLLVAPKNDSLGVWHHYAFVFTPGDSIRLYIDTVEVASERSTALTLDSNTDSLRIGMGISGTGLIGSLDEFRIWNISRSLASIKQSLYNTLSGKDTGLVAYYSFDDVAGSKRVHDFSGHGHDGFLQGINGEIVPSSSPIVDQSPGFALAAVEQHIILPTLRCTQAFDTVIHLRNLGTVPIVVDTAGPRVGVAFSIITVTPFTLAADSNKVDSIRIHFQPPVGGVFTDSLYIASSSICGGRIVIGLRGAYDSVGLRRSPDTLNFGPVSSCELPTIRKLTLTNTSVTDSVTILNVVSPPGIRVLTQFPIHLKARQDTTLMVELLQGTRGSLTASITFDLDKCSNEVIENIRATRALASLSVPQPIDLGTVQASLAGTVVDTTIIVTNNGDVVNWIASIAAQPDTVLTIRDGRIGRVMVPGDTVHVHIRMHTSECGTTSAQLLLNSFACQFDTSTTISITVAPPVPVHAPDLDMGMSCMARDTAIYISNPNSAAIRLDTITFMENGVFTTNAFFPILISAHDSALVQLRFDPGTVGVYSDTAFFRMSPCGEGMAVFNGSLGFQSVAFTTEPLLFGRGCKTDTVTLLDTVVNSSSDTVMFLANTYRGSTRFSIAPFSFPVVLPPHGYKVLSISYIPALGFLDSGTFTFITSQGCNASTLSLRGSREIAKAQWDVLIGAFDTVCSENPVVRTYTLLDHGIDTIDVLSASVTGANFTLLHAPKDFKDSGKFQIEFSPTDQKEYTGLLTVTVDSCGHSFSLPLTGSGGPKPELTVNNSTLSFDSLLVGDSQELCISVTNPSCQPISLSIDSATLLSSPFSITQSAGLLKVARGDTATICIQFKPSTFGTYFLPFQINADSTTTVRVDLSGTGLSPRVEFHPHVLDFGYVIVDSVSSRLTIFDTNSGNLTAQIVATHNDPEFLVNTPATLLPRTSGSFDVNFHPVSEGLSVDTLRLLWNGHNDSVLLRGFGTKRGLQASSVELDFGNVHVGTDSTLPLYLFATNNFPTIDSVTLEWIGPAPHDTFFDTVREVLPYTIANVQDSLLIRVSYHAVREQMDAAQLVIHYGPDSTVVLLTGRGVEAHPWITPTSFSIIGAVVDSSSSFPFIRIQDTGLYPLFIRSIHSSDPAFVPSPISPSEAILPGEVRFDTVIFTPTSSRFVTGTLDFETSYHDTTVRIEMVGNGIYPANKGPDFGFTIASRTQEVPGQLDTIPITMSGTRLSRIDTNTIILDIRFDPLLVKINGSDASWKLVNDSTLELIVSSLDTNGGIIARLYTAALLGPDTLSFIHVIDSKPLFDRPESLIDGEFAEVDCGGSVHGIVFSGPNSTSAIVPNPTSDKAILQFVLGLSAEVKLEVYNEIGETVKLLKFEDLKAGSNAVTIDVSDLPEGEYLYRLSSLEYQSTGTLVVLR